jgi:hypothetical protein
MSRALWSVLLAASCATADPSSLPGAAPPPVAATAWAPLRPRPGLVLPGAPPRMVGTLSDDADRGLVVTTWTGLAFTYTAAPIPDRDIASIWLEDLDADGDLDLGVASAAGITGYDPATWAQTLFVDRPVLAGWVRTVQADGDPERELAVVSDYEVQLYDLDGTFVSSWSSWRGLDAAPCELDGDPEPEVIAEPNRRIGVDLATGAPVTAVLPDGATCAADLDGDGVHEVRVEAGATAFFVDGQTGAGRFALGSDGGYTQGYVFRAPGGRRELSGEIDNVPVQFDAIDGRPIGSVPPGFDPHIAASSLPWDLDGDGLDDFVYLGLPYAAWHLRGSAGWQRTEHTTELEAVGADVDGDGRQELVARSESGFAVRDGLTGALRWTSALTGSSAFPIAGGDVDGDGRAEVGLTLTAGGAVVGRPDPAGFATLWSTPAATYGVWLRDVTGDDVAEIFTANGAELCRFDALSTTPTWCIQPGQQVTAIEPFDFNGDGVNELAILDTRLTVRRASDGEALSSFAQHDRSLSVINGRLITSTRVGSSLRFEEVRFARGTLERRTVRDLDGTPATLSVAAGGTIYVGTWHAIEAIDLTTGARSATPLTGLRTGQLRLVPVDGGVWVRETTTWVRFGG